MKTAAHSTFTGPGRIVISQGAPRGGSAVGGYKIYRALAPTNEIRQLLEHDAYREKYRADVLAPLVPLTVWTQLHTLAGGAEPVIQCFERPPFTERNWCHRRMVAEWFFETLGQVVDELEPETAQARYKHAAEWKRSKAV